MASFTNPEQLLQNKNIVINQLYKSFIGNVTTRYGIKNKSTAKEWFIKKDLIIDDLGLILNKDNHF